MPNLITKQYVRIALVSGGNRGIGYEIVRQLAGLGYTAILGARDPEKGEAAARALAARVNARIVARQLDVVDAQGIKNLAREITEEFGWLDILVNNAAVHYDARQIATKADIEGIVHESFETNVFGAWRMIKAFVPLMQRHRWGRIVNVSSGAGSLTSMGAGTPAYSTKQRSTRSQGRGRRIAHERHSR